MIRKILFIAAVLSLLAYLGVLTISLIDKSGLKKVTVITYPGVAQVSFNGSPPTTNQTNYYLEPGNYTATISMDGFSTEQIRIETDRHTDHPVLGSLTPQSEAATAWVAENQAEYRQFETQSSQILRQEGEALRERYPIVSNLPANTNLYSIGYIQNDDGSIVVTIHAPDVYVPYAINHIKRWGVDPEDYEIEFVNQRNIFKDE